MGFEQPPTRVGSSRARLSIIAVLAASIALVAFAVAGKAPAPAPSPPIAVTASGGPSSAPSRSPGNPLFAAGPGPSAVPSEAPAIRQLPDDIECKDVGYDSCLLVAVAAIRSLPQPLPPIRSASVWKSLLCDSSLDCPPARLRGVVPLGSVVLAFDDGTTWVNVVGRQTAAGTVPSYLRLEAWSVR